MRRALRARPRRPCAPGRGLGRGLEGGAPCRGGQRGVGSLQHGLRGARALASQTLCQPGRGPRPGPSRARLGDRGCRTGPPRLRWGTRGPRPSRSPRPRPPQLVRYSAEGLLQLGPLGSTTFLPDSKCLVDEGRARTPALKKCEDVARPAQRLWDFAQVRGPGRPVGQTLGGALTAVGVPVTCSRVNSVSRVRPPAQRHSRRGAGRSAQPRLTRPPPTARARRAPGTATRKPSRRLQARGPG